MNTDSGRFVEEAEAKAWMKRISIGEVVEVKGEEFEVEEIRERHLVLKMLSKSERAEKRLGAAGVNPLDLNRASRRSLDSKARKKKRR